jgi:hypothetical protein
MHHRVTEHQMRCARKICRTNHVAFNATSLNRLRRSSIGPAHPLASKKRQGTVARPRHSSVSSMPYVKCCIKGNSAGFRSSRQPAVKL